MALSIAGTVEKIKSLLFGDIEFFALITATQPGLKATNNIGGL